MPASLWRLEQLGRLPLHVFSVLVKIAVHIIYAAGRVRLCSPNPAAWASGYACLI